MPRLRCLDLEKCTEVLVKVLKDVVNSPYAPEYDIAGITDPFLHIRLLRLLRVLGQGDADASDCMNDILAQMSAKYLGLILGMLKGEEERKKRREDRMLTLDPYPVHQ
ncbi:AP-1 complex subunit gamma-2 [Vitis vinifera]|uniref:AP-1 complex subunit gamma-2 n=1 Tax=Vitis vinifera TaxID=29760 RepID=A0A438JND4_VITVI|nr:AP-1 complex subunit gamma-2 [Vitis vinifera]